MDKVGPYTAGPEFRISNASAGDHLYSNVAPLPRGFVASYSRPVNGKPHIFARIFDDHGQPSSPELRISTFVAHRQSTSAAASLQSCFFMVWANYMREGEEADIYGRLFALNGSALGPEARINTWTIGQQGSPRVAALLSAFVVSFVSSADGSDTGIRGRLVHRNGTPIGDEFHVNTYTASVQYLTGLATVGTGFMPVWHSAEQDGSGYGVFGRLFNNAAQPLTEEVPINNYTMGRQLGPDIASWPGGCIVVWTSEGQDGDSGGIYGQLFAEDASKIGTEFRINNDTRGNQANPVVIGSHSGFVIVWTGDRLGGGTAIYGQLLSLSAVPVGPTLAISETNFSDHWGTHISATGSGFVVVWQNQGSTGPRTVLGRAFILPTATAPVLILSSYRTPTTLPSGLPLATTTSFNFTSLSLTTSALGTIQRSSPVSSAGLGSTNTALILVIVGLVLSIFGSLGLYFYNRRKYTALKAEDHDRPMYPIYSERPPLEQSHGYTIPRSSQVDNQYQQLTLRNDSETEKVEEGRG